MKRLSGCRLRATGCGVRQSPTSVFPGARSPKPEARLHAPSGYAMAAMLIALAVMAVFLSVAMPVWRQSARREKEEELIFRGTQYARAIGLFQRKYAAAYPPSIDVLLEQKFLRKKYKDPITNDEFQIVPLAQATPGTQTPPGGRGQGTGPSPTGTGLGRGLGGVGGGNPGVPAGIAGVASKSKDESIRLYNGRNHYNEWAFVYAAPALQPGQPGQPGGRGGPQPPGRGVPPGQGPGRGSPPFPGGQGNPPTMPIPPFQPGRGR